MKTTGKRILVVQPHEILCLGLQTYLQICGLHFASCDLALRLAKAHRLLEEKKPDLVIVDPFMEQNGGIQFLLKLQEYKPVPIAIAYAAHFHLEDIQRCLNAGAAAAVSHQIDGKRLIEICINALTGMRRVVATSVEAPLDRLNSGWRVRGSLLEKLSKQQREVFRLLGSALPVKEIARTMNISARSVETYESRLKESLNLNSNSDLRRAAILHHAWEEAFTETT